MKTMVVVVTAVLLMFAAPYAGAAYTWDGDTGTAGIQDGTGVWDTTTANWWDDVGLADVVWPNLNTATAVFGGGTAGTAGTITVDSVTANKLTFNAAFSGNYTLDGGTITLSGTAPTITANTTATISSILSCSTGFAKAGTGMLILSNASTDAKLTAGTTILGTLRLDNGTKLTGLGTVYVANNAVNATLTLNDSSTLLVTAAAADLLIAQSSGNSHVGTINVNGTATLTIARNLRVGGDGGTNNRMRGVMNVTGGTTTVGSKITVQNSGDNNYGTGLLNITGGSVSADTMAINIQRQKGADVDVKVLTAGTLVVTNGITFAIANDNNTLSTATLTVGAGGTLQTKSITGVADHTNGKVRLALTGGTVIATGDSAAFISGFTVAPVIGASGITFDSNGYAITIGQGMSGTGGNLTKTGSGTLTLTGSNTYTGGTTNTAGTLEFASGSLGTTGSIVMNGGTLKWQSGNAEDVSSRFGFTDGVTAKFDTTNNDVSFGTALGGNIALQKLGAGTLSLASGNSYSGDTTISAGTLSIMGGVALADAGAVLLANVSGATLKLNNDETIGSIEGGGATGGNINLQANTLTAGDANDKTFGGVMDGVGGRFIKQGTGKLTLTNAQTYDGGTEIQDGTLELSGSGSLADGGSVLINAAGAKLDLGGGNETVGAVTLTDGEIANGTLTGSGFTVKRGTVSANLAGGVGTTLIKQTVNTTTLSGVNTYGGLTTVSAGTLVVDGSVANGAQVNAGTLQVNGTVSGGATVAGGTLNVAGAGTLNGGATVTGGKLIAGGTVNGAVSVSGTGTLSGGGTLAGATTVGAGGTLSPGNSPGQLTHESGLTLANGSTYVWELVTNDNTGLPGTDYDQELITGGNLAIDSGATLSLVFNSAGSSVDWSNLFWADPHQWVIMDFSGTGTSSGNFGTVTVSLDSGDQNLADVRPEYMFSSVRSGNNLVLNYDVIPEPATAGVLLLGLMGVALRRRALNAD